MSQTKFNHAYTFAVEIPGSSDPHGSDVTGEQIRAALLKRIHSLSDTELLEAVDSPYDSYEETQASRPKE